MRGNEKVENMENEPKLKVVFDLDSEVERVSYTIKKIPWFKENGYYSHLKLPKNISETSSDENISAAISSEFDPNLYKEYADYIETDFPNIEKQLEIFEQLKSFDLKDQYTIQLTRYGTGGSYDTQKGVIQININSYPKERMLEIIIHEITHIGVEELIKKYNVKHWHKEKIVDLIDGKLFPDLNNPQRYKMDVSFVEDIFNKYFPDLETIIKMVGETNFN